MLDKNTFHEFDIVERAEKPLRGAGNQECTLGRNHG
jgi:hypothetical protein